MRALSATEMLDVWERGLAISLPLRLLMLIDVACEGTEEIGRLSIGQRDERLLTLREWAFGPRLTALAECPSCNERVELDLRTTDLRVMTSDQPPEPLHISVSGYDLVCHHPNTLDMIALANERDAEVAYRMLLNRCIVAAVHGTSALAIDDLPRDVLDMAIEQIERADPQADVRLGITCPECAHAWSPGFDIGSFFWREIDAWARRLLSEVHALAWAYKWHEQDIVRMSPWRRQFYLNCIGK